MERLFKLFPLRADESHEDHDGTDRFCLLCSFVTKAYLLDETDYRDYSEPCQDDLFDPTRMTLTGALE